MRLLLAEDEKELSAALTAIFKHNNYSVDAVYNGEDALDYLQTDLYDAAILDIMMPKMDGLTVLKKIREQGSNVPIIMLAAVSGVDNKVTGLDLGADDYLTKPFSTKELLARVRAITRRKEDLTNSVLTFADLNLNRTTYELSCGEKHIKLSNKDFQMLEMLMVSPGQIISTEQFMDKIWGYDSNAELNVVWVYISNLRKKLNQIHSEVTIKATRNLGYSVEAKHA
jgi:two-component system response regulator ArlR